MEVKFHMLLVVEIIGVLCMLTIMFVSIWGFIIARQSYSQIKYQNYLMEKLNQNLYLLISKNKSDLQFLKKDVEKADS